eukprot:5119768-Pyramimonas_sp.AAC.1
MAHWTSEGRGGPMSTVGRKAASSSGRRHTFSIPRDTSVAKVPWASDGGAPNGSAVGVAALLALSTQGDGR